MRTLAPGVLALLIAAVVATGVGRASEEPSPPMLVGGEQLREGCRGTGMEPGVCRGYVGAVIDLERFHSQLAEREPLYCIPEGLELGALTESVSRWLAGHPEQAGRAAVAQVTVALIASYPCANAHPAAPAP